MSRKLAVAQITGTTDMSFRRYHATPKKDREADDAWENRTWRNGLHVNEQGNVVIPAIAIKNALTGIAKYLGIKIPGGGGRANYTKKFKSSILPVEDADLRIKVEDIKGLPLFVPANGRPGGESRVERIFPIIPRGWKTELKVLLLDAIITPDVFEKHLKECGVFIGFGALRVGNGGFWGRFKVDNINYEEFKI